MIEFELRIPVALWLLSRGLSPVCEVASLGNCDMVGIRFTTTKPARLIEMVAVELKLANVASVLRQCDQQIGRQVTEVWAAMPRAVAERNVERFDVAGVGLLAVEGRTVTELVAADRFMDRNLTRWAKTMHRRRNEWQWRMQNHNMLRVVQRKVDPLRNYIAR